MSKEYRTLETAVQLPYKLAYGKTWSRFFDGMKEEKIFGSKCPKCSRILVPARTFCPRCFVDTDEWVECPQEGALIAWSLTNYTYYAQPIESPFITGLIRLDATDVNFLHLIGGFEIGDMQAVRQKVKNGMRVKAVWEKEKRGHILDIKYFEPL